MTIDLEEATDTTTLGTTGYGEVVSESADVINVGALLSDDKMAGVMVGGILTFAFVTLVVLMAVVCWWSFANAG